MRHRSPRRRHTLQLKVSLWAPESSSPKHVSSFLFFHALSLSNNVHTASAYSRAAGAARSHLLGLLSAAAPQLLLPVAAARHPRACGLHRSFWEQLRCPP